MINFNDSGSDEDEDEDVVDMFQLNDSGNINYKDTEGNKISLKANLRLRNYSSVF